MTEPIKPTAWDFNEEKIKDEHPGAIILSLDLSGETYMFAFKRPTRAHISMATSSAKKMNTHLLNMVNDCRQVPDRQTLDSFFDYFPGSIASLGGKLLEEVGLVDADRRP